MREGNMLCNKYLPHVNIVQVDRTNKKQLCMMIARYVAQMNFGEIEGIL